MINEKDAITIDYDKCEYCGVRGDVHRADCENPEVPKGDEHYWDYVYQEIRDLNNK